MAAPGVGGTGGEDIGARKEFARASLRDLAGLGARLAARSEAGSRLDFTAALSTWSRELLSRTGAPGLTLDLKVVRLGLVGDRAVSRYLLEQAPSLERVAAGRMKVGGMSFLAPAALVISHGRDWEELRPFNERVLCAGGVHDHARAFLSVTVEAFARPIRSADDVRAAMGDAMLGIVFGPGVAPKRLVRDIQVLFATVKKALRRKLLGFLYARRRDRFYAELRRCWDVAGSGDGASLVAMARGLADESSERILQQIPHWMFTFTGSGTDLLVRTLAVISSRADVAARVRAEIGAAGPLDDPGAVAGLTYLEACLLETGRLFPPVAVTFHRTARDASVDGARIPAGLDLMHFFPALHRDAGPTADRFEPERHAPGGEDALEHDVFLSGARACPGRELILLVCKAAAARLVAAGRLPEPIGELGRERMPPSFPAHAIAFR